MMWVKGTNECHEHSNSDGTSKIQDANKNEDGEV